MRYINLRLLTYYKYIYLYLLFVGAIYKYLCSYLYDNKDYHHRHVCYVKPY